jgi:hypothetical protein
MWLNFLNALQQREQGKIFSRPACATAAMKETRDLRAFPCGEAIVPAGHLQVVNVNCRLAMHAI